MDYRSAPLTKYLDDAAAAQPTPGGGSVAAVAAALASTMASMAAAFTAGKEKFKDVESEIQEALGRLATLRARLLDLAHADMDAYAAVMAAYRLAKASDEAKADRAAAIAKATRDSLDVVEAVLVAVGETIRIGRRLADVANPNLASDVGVAAELALGAARAAAVNVAVNLVGYQDAADAAAVRRRTDQAVAEAERVAVETRRIVMNRLAK
ncbi:MAG TPA: cyclodeaminase/cyclohydrolase family protein [Phycisphaerae bacterium]|nr:cyclodeaminase/cyclohydrolase family protein [Phycisphaerae bacterium]